MITHTISVAELIWTLFCLIGLVFNSRIFIRAAGDFAYARKKRGDSIREYAARLTLITYGTWAFAQLLFVLVGLVSMLLPPANSTQAVSPFQITVTIGFLVISAALAISSVIIERGRAKIVSRMTRMDVSQE